MSIYAQYGVHYTSSLIIDGEGYLHIAWEHRVDPLHYARNVAPGAITLFAPESTIGADESGVTYPEFHALTSIDFLFTYRGGSSVNEPESVTE